jgi:hypothetical protein
MFHSAGRQVGSPQEVADLITFLVSPRAGSISGSEHLIDRGLVRPSRARSHLEKKCSKARQVHSVETGDLAEATGDAQSRQRLRWTQYSPTCAPRPGIWPRSTFRKLSEIPPDSPSTLTHPLHRALRSVSSEAD